MIPLPPPTPPTREPGILIVCILILTLKYPSIFHQFFTTSYQAINLSIMVHLSTVTADSEQEHPIIKQLGDIKIDEWEDDDEETENIYGSKFANEGLPHNNIPDKEMPKEVAARLIRDHLRLASFAVNRSLGMVSDVCLSLDGNPTLNLAS